MDARFQNLVRAGARLWAHRGFLLASIIAVILAAGQRAQAAAPAGVSIINVASLSYRLGGAEYGAASNSVAVVIGEIIDFSVAPIGDLTVVAGSDNQGVAYRLTNRGNGPRAFALALDPALGADSFDPIGCRIYVDPSNAAAPNIAAAQPYVRGSEPVLAPGQVVTVWAVCDMPDGATGSGRVALIVRPVVTTGDTATPIWTPDHATATNAYWIEADLRARLIKSQSVVDRMGRPRAIKGATVTYTLAASLSGVGTAQNLTISDPIPAGATYVPGSLTLDGVSLTDNAGDDVGQAGAAGVLVRLGDLPAPALRTVTFQALINP
jgi:uncharacterized repeat protein (TIGR01451 family)